MSEEQQPNETLISEEDKNRIKNAFFSKTATLLPLGVLIKASRNEEEIDVAITNEDIADIYNAINGESPYEEEPSNE